MATIKDIERLTQKYADARGTLAAQVHALQAELEAARRKYVKTITALADRARQRQAELHEAIEGAPELFTKPRTYVFAGVKVGFKKGKGKVVFEDPARVVELIERHLGDQAELLIITEKSPNKEAILQLSAADVKRIGCQITGTDDAVVIKDATGDVDKLVAALLKEEAEETEA